MDVSLRIATPDELAAIARLIAHENGRPERQCLHLGDVPEEILAEMRAEIPAPESQIVVAVRRSGSARTGTCDVVGVLGGDLDPTSATAWLWGPYVSTDEPDRWARTAGALLDRLCDVLPVRPTRLHAYFNVESACADAFLESRGFADLGLAHVYVARHPGDRQGGDRPARDTPCVDLPEDATASFAALHREAFPDTWCTAKEMLEKRDEGDRLLVTLDGAGKVTGYVHAGLGDGGVEGYVHYLAVRPDARHRGLGGALLDAAMDWLFTVHDVRQVGLNVRDGLDDARSLYERVGFRLVHTGRVRRLDVKP